MGKGKGGYGHRLFRALVPLYNCLVNPCRCQCGQNGPKCVGRLHSTTHETLTGPCEHVTMITPCQSCGHKLWSVEREVKGWLVRVHFDGEETSETYADQVTCCP